MRTVLPQIVELYEIIADTIHTLTTSREPVLWRGAEWTPAAVERGELRGSVDGKAATVTLTACMDTLLTRYLASLPILPTRVNIYEHEPESGDTVQVFGGVVLEVIPGADATQVSVNEAAWEAFRAEAESWLGTPYRHLQRCKGRGADCTLFVGQALLDAGLLTRLEYDYYARDWHEHTRDEYVLEASHRHMRDYLRPGLEMASLPVGTPLLRGDWLAFSTTERRVTNHCGLVWPCADGGFQMLHAINDRGVSFTPLGNWWLRRMTRHFRIVIAEAEVAAWA